MALLSGLSLGCIQRLKKTWEVSDSFSLFLVLSMDWLTLGCFQAVPKQYTTLFATLTTFMESQGNYRNYRNFLKQAEPPLLPYIGL
jgi:hypothetical protein